MSVRFAPTASPSGREIGSSMTSALPRLPVIVFMIGMFVSYTTGSLGSAGATESLSAATTKSLIPATDMDAP